MKKSLLSLTVIAAAVTSLASVAQHGAERVAGFVGDAARKAHDSLVDYMGRAGLMAFAVVQTKALTISNRDAVPAVINDGRLERSTLETSVGSVAVGAADSPTSYFVLASLPSSALVRAIYATCVAGMTTLAGNIGVFKNTKDAAGATLAVPANTGSGTLFASAQSFASALSRSDVTNQSGTYDTQKREQPLWQAIGLLSDPNTTFDIGVVVSTANTGAAGRLGLEIHYVDNSA